jgi:CheY-like chemotaxis protein
MRFGTSKFARLQRLKISHRSSSRASFEIHTFLATAKSTFTYPLTVEREGTPRRVRVHGVEGQMEQISTDFQAMRAAVDQNVVIDSAQLAENCRLADTWQDIPPARSKRESPAPVCMPDMRGRMRLRILAQPTGTIAGVALGQFHVGGIYDLGPQVAGVFLAERWAESVGDDETPAFVCPPPPAVAHIAPLLLFVDDDAMMRRMTETLLIAHGYRVIVAVHGRDGIERLREQCPDLIVLDVNMPVMDGYQFRREQRYLPDKKRAAVPVLLMTGENDAPGHADALQAAGVITKPFDPDDLLDAVSAAIKRPGSAPDGIGSPRPWRTGRSHA